MKKHLHLLTAGILFTCLSFSTWAQICNPSGNYIIFSNYDGGRLHINVDVNIPNLKIGIVSYEAVEVTISGTYVGNVVAVDYSGYNSSPSSHCPPSISTTTITGFASPTINTIPPATLSDPDGYPYIICAYNCGGTTGGCNTSNQVQHYYQTMFGGSMYFHYTQYGCWSAAPYAISAGGTCCPTPTLAPVADFTVSSDSVCAGDCIDITDVSANSPTSWNWTLSGGSPGTASIQHPTACYNTPGSYNITLSATNGVGTDVVTKSITVLGVNTTTSVSSATITALATGATYQWKNCSTGVIIGGATTQVFNAPANGLYAVIVTQNGCTDTSACVNITSVGLTPSLSGEEVRVYPNPSSEWVILEDKYGIMKNATIVLTNTLGEVVYTAVWTEDKKVLDLSAIPVGVYYISLKTAEHQLVKKLVRE